MLIFFFFFYCKDNVDLASSICMNEKLVKKILSLAETSVVTSVPAEAQRLLAAAIKYSSSEGIYHLFLFNKRFQKLFLEFYYRQVK